MDYSTPGLPVHHQLPEFTQEDSQKAKGHVQGHKASPGCSCFPGRASFFTPSWDRAWLPSSAALMEHLPDFLREKGLVFCRKSKASILKRTILSGWFLGVTVTCHQQSFPWDLSQALRMMVWGGTQGDFFPFYGRGQLSCRLGWQLVVRPSSL